MGGRLYIYTFICHLNERQRDILYYITWSAKTGACSMDDHNDMIVIMPVSLRYATIQSLYAALFNHFATIRLLHYATIQSLHAAREGGRLHSPLRDERYSVASRVPYLSLRDEDGRRETAGRAPIRARSADPALPPVGPCFAPGCQE